MIDEKSITRSDYLKVVGLITLSNSHNKALHEIETALAEVVGEQPDEYGYAGHVTDIVCERDASADVLLVRLGIKVEDV